MSGLRVLALDVSGPGGGAALLTPGGCTVATIPPAVARGRDLVPLLAGLLTNAGLAAEDLDVVACGVGPGSFTGIRIAVATAATFAYAAGLPVLDVCSLDGLAANAPEDAKDVCVILDARRGDLFVRRERVFLAPAEEVAAQLAPDTYVLGEGRTKYPELFEGFPGTAEAPVRPDAIARIAAARFAAGERKDPGELRPLYLRLSDPEIRRGMS